jgi:hypothetical protein
MTYHETWQRGKGGLLRVGQVGNGRGVFELCIFDLPRVPKNLEAQRKPGFILQSQIRLMDRVRASKNGALFLPYAVNF